ncbi:lactate racemase domain-containing protein [Sporomusa sphaeroides]|uniref:lactate racemase domain-containing protein n=1 Tax=Sporomusa sphaeroides TaxID=47679 RepID=UPI003DA1B498
MATIGIIQELLADIPMPRMVKVRQNFIAPELDNVVKALGQEFQKPGIGDRIMPGMRIAIAVGSRGVAEISAITRATVAEIKKRGGQPFVVPGMGSHGGATAEGQEQVLKELGVTADSVGCPIISSMEVVEVGKLANGLAVLIDKHAYEADGIVVINRVKPHTAYRGPCESGLAKMLTIGLGKQKGADSCHAYSFKHMAEHVVEMAKIKIAQTPVLFGIATVENAYDRVAKIVAVPAEKIIEVDQKLLIEAKERMPRILFEQIDVLIVDRIGKEISGDGMDPNITGRYATPYASGGPEVVKLVVLDLTPQTHGNANGMGTADFTTRKLFHKIDFESTYANCLTSTIAVPARIPLIMETDKEAVLAAIKTCNARDLSKAKIVRIKDTLHLGEIYISEALLAEAADNPAIEVSSQPANMQFDTAGNLIW